MSRVPADVDLLLHERELYRQGYRFLAGIDEAGRGPLAGPVVATCVIVDMQKVPCIEGVYDSKALTERQRFLLYERICSEFLAWGVGVVDNTEIDRINIYQAARKAMGEALYACHHPYDAVLVDAMPLALEKPVLSLVKGDQRSFLIAAASIVAKVYRDRLMDELHAQYPYYGWDKNRGYPTKQHREAIIRYGLSPFHRLSFDCYGKGNPDKCPPDKIHVDEFDREDQTPAREEDTSVRGKIGGSFHSERNGYAEKLPDSRFVSRSHDREE
ncbi:ribonuclease HII [Thermospira aquatica]|uniref:Ribonuclease HII n=1 Tax=Thermospira aquatica TaxID=2828656 RepID=A0AAX3BAX2_9SPIR|nr:ribonuclease HII [Thermospira aquatica]URA09385.1 ribonuclease HII [Thermospira aquatica]